MKFMTFHILGMSSSQLIFTPSFFRGVGFNHQPDKDFCFWKYHVLVASKPFLKENRQFFVFRTVEESNLGSNFGC